MKGFLEIITSHLFVISIPQGDLLYLDNCHYQASVFLYVTPINVLVMLVDV